MLNAMARREYFSAGTEFEQAENQRIIYHYFYKPTKLIPRLRTTVPVKF